MAVVETDWENFPSYAELWHGIRDFMLNIYEETFITKREPLPIELTWRYYNFTLFDISFVIFLAIVWTIFRYVASEWVFKPLAHHYALTPTNQSKMPESAWKFVYYLCAWCYTCYVVILSGDYKFFQKPSTVWEDWNLNESPPMNIYFLYMAQCGFYLHSLYATVFLDTWRKDSLVMMIHHVLTLLLIAFSYSLRYHNIGTLVLFTHDVCDIFLEFTKLNVYFKIQNNKLVQMHEMFANVSFVCFTVAWYIARLYWYPLRVLYTATADVNRLQLVLPCALLMNLLLWTLQLLNIYWFFFIVQFLFRVATGQMNEVDDTREYDVEEKLLGKKEHSFSNSNNDIQNHNGTVKSNGSACLNGDATGVVKRHLS